MLGNHRVKCEICEKEFSILGYLSSHVKLKHTETTIKKYYDNYLKKEDEGYCYYCGNETEFNSFTFGYKKVCNNKECIKKITFKK